MQVVDAPVKVPDKVPNFATAKPKGDTAAGKGKKHKVLLFNDNVNRREYVAKVLTRSIPDYSQADAYMVRTASPWPLPAAAASPGPPHPSILAAPPRARAGDAEGSQAGDGRRRHLGL